MLKKITVPDKPLPLPVYPDLNSKKKRKAKKTMLPVKTMAPPPKRETIEPLPISKLSLKKKVIIQIRHILLDI